MMAASRSACWSTLARRSARSTLPASSQATTTTRMPAMTAPAALVPCAVAGARRPPPGGGPRRGRRAGHGRAGGVGAVRGAGDQADVAVLLAAGAVVAADGQQPGALPLAPGRGGPG